jgi:arylsulfatase A-like enzyme
LSINGNTSLRTPNLDSLARTGVSFDRFYVCAVCAPTRAEFLTGRYHSRGGVRGVSTGQERLNTDERTLADMFKAEGYATGAFGKWHNGSQWPYHPNARGFDEYYGFTPATGANTSTRRWNTTASPFAARVISPMT